MTFEEWYENEPLGHTCFTLARSAWEAGRKQAVEKKAGHNKAARFSGRVEKINDRVYLKFDDGAGVGVSRDCPEYLNIVGEWFCREMEILPGG